MSPTMKKRLTWVVILTAILVSPMAVVVIWGATLPREHRATVAAEIAAPPERVYATITDWTAQPSWREGVTRVEMLAAVGGRTRILEDGEWGPITIEVVETQPPRRLITRIVDEEEQFGGTWTYELVSVGEDATRVTITEDGWVDDPLFRFLSAYVFGHDTTLRQYQSSLARRMD